MGSARMEIRNYSGIPVVYLEGRMDLGALREFQGLLTRLVLAGHCNALVNMKQAEWMPEDAAHELSRLADLFRAHYGKLGIIADRDQIDAMPAGIYCGSFSTSEDQAVRRIKGLAAPIELQWNRAELV